MTSVFTVVIVCLQFLLMFLLSPFGITQSSSYPRWYLEWSVPNRYLILPLRFFLLNVAMVPSTLKVTLEFTKILYTLFLHHDPHYEEERGNVHCNAMALHETLGCVRFVLTDKTGTLTKNKLILKEVVLAGKVLSIQPYDESVYAIPSTISLPDETPNQVSHMIWIE